MAPYRIDATRDDLQRDRMHGANLGDVTVMDLQMSAMRVSYDGGRSGHSGLDEIKLSLTLRGNGYCEQDDRGTTQRAGEFHLMDLRRPQLAVSDGQHLALAVIPRSLIHVRDRDLRSLTAVPFGSEDPYGALTGSFARELVRHVDAYDPVRGTQVATTFADLLTLAIASRVDRIGSVPVDSRERAMTARARAYIEQHLADPGLSPTKVAAACRISVRTLHKLFEAEELTVADTIRQHRLERCRTDLLDPALERRPVGAIGIRWGFPDSASFSRSFRARYGLPPAAYRSSHRPAPAPDDSSGRVSA